jgi:hypothetical protein
VDETFRNRKRMEFFGFCTCSLDVSRLKIMDTN